MLGGQVEVRLGRFPALTWILKVSRKVTARWKSDRRGFFGFYLDSEGLRLLPPVGRDSEPGQS